MTEINKSKNQPGDSSNADVTTSVVDMLLSKPAVETLDSEHMILETQKRVWGALQKRL